jgi:hypothetical protein
MYIPNHSPRVKMTMVVCPNDAVQQWKERLIEAFPDSYVITER